MSIQERLHQVIDRLKLSPSVFADRIGVQRSNLSHVLSGRNKPGLDFLEKIINHFPQIDAHWLLTGRINNENIGLDPKGEVKKISLNDKKVKRIVLIYNDDTFEVLNG